MPRPVIGKGKPWEKPPDKKVERKYAVIKYLHHWNDPNQFEVQAKWVVDISWDYPHLKKEIEVHPNAEYLIGGLSKEDARMWAKMME